MDKKSIEMQTGQDVHKPFKWPENWVTNVSRNPYSPINMINQVLSAKGFHILIEAKAFDQMGEEIPDYSSIYVDNLEERKKYDFIFDALIRKPQFGAFSNAAEGFVEIINLDELDVTEEEKKQLKALSLKQKIAKTQKNGGSSAVKNWQKELDALDVSPYQLQQMRDKIAEMVDEILSENPEQKP